MSAFNKKITSLIASHWRDLQPETVTFEGTDTQKLFKRNLKKQPADWIYRKKPVSYTFNSRGFRASELDSLDWNNSLVIFGCSNTLGTGVAYEDTVGEQLSQLIKRPVINLGVGGGSLYLSYINTLKILETHRPLGIVYCWTNYGRIVQFDRNSINHLGHWSSPGIQRSLHQTWNMPQGHSEIYALTIQQSIKLLCTTMNVPFLQFSYFQETADLLGCRWFPIIDTARDLSHPGIETHRHAAEYLAQCWVDNS